MSSSIKFQDEADFFISEAEQALLTLERSATDITLQKSTLNILCTLRGIADLFNLDNIHSTLMLVADIFETTIGKTVPAELLDTSIDLIERIRTTGNNDLSSKEYQDIMADFAPFTDAKIKITSLNKKPKEVRILVVDDELVNRTLLVEFIKTFHPDIDITSADSATEAIFHYLREDFDLVFLDIMMPEVDGNHFIAIVEKNRALGNLTGPANIIVQTAVQSLSELLNIVQQDCVLEVIRKPIHRERISTCIERYCTPATKP